MEKSWGRRLAAFVIVAVLLAVSFIAGYKTRDVRGGPLRQARAANDLLAPRLFVSNPNDSIVGFSKLRTELEAYVGSLNTNVSLYFEYLPTGTSINTGDKNTFVAASLMKIPLAMNLMRLSELGKLDLDQKVSLKKEWLNSEFGTLYQKGEGFTLTYRDALAVLLKDSDNTAAMLIQDTLAKNPLPEEEDSLYSMDVTIELNSEKRAIVSARSYSSVLKCLYFACFLNKADSQELLTYLTQSSFADRLVSGLPNGVKVAHKIGTFSQETQSDCGIVYLERRNYSLCVMVDMADPEGSKTIAYISKVVYDFVSSQTARSN